MKEICDNFLIDNITNFCENNFNDGNLKVQLENYRLLLEYLKKMDFNDLILDINDIKIMIKKSGKLEKMISTINNSSLSEDFIDDEFLQQLISYKTSIDLDSYIKEENEELVYDEETEIYDETNKNSNQKITDILTMYFNELPSRVLSAEEERELLIKYKENHDIDAGKKLIEYNLRFVVKIAKSFNNNNNDLLDLIQEGNIGLKDALEKYDLSYNVRLSTFAYWSIKLSIKRFIVNSSKLIRIPVYLDIIKEGIKRATTQYVSMYGKEPTVEELSRILGVSIKRIKKALLLTDSVSINTIVVNDGYESEIGDFIEDINVNDETFIGNIYKSQLIDAINNSDLNDKEKAVVFYRYGFFNDEPLTLEETSIIIGVTKQRVAQIEQRAIEKLKPALESFRNR